jgi:hypothetical protein
MKVVGRLQGEALIDPSSATMRMCREAMLTRAMYVQQLPFNSRPITRAVGDFQGLREPPVPLSFKELPQFGGLSRR